MERKKYKRYSREFKLAAVRLAALSEKPKAQIVRELGIRGYAGNFVNSFLRREVI